MSLILFVSIGSYQIQAQTTRIDRSGDLGKRNAITTAVPFLLIAPDSRLGGMGEVGVAVLEDGNAQHWNPSKYLFSSNDAGISISYSPWLAGLQVHDIYHLYLSAYYNVTKMNTISFSLRFFSMGDMELTTDQGEVIMHSKPHEFAIDAAYSRMLIKDVLSMSVTGRFVYSNLSPRGINNSHIKPGIAGAADISLLYRKKFSRGKLYNHNLNLGLNISNLGNKVSYSEAIDRDFLPANFRLGIAYDMYFDQYNKLTLAFDVNKLLVPTPPLYETDSVGKVIENQKDPSKIGVAEAVFTSWGDAPDGFKEEMNEFILNFGLEYTYRELISIRAGYFNEAVTKGARKYMTFGVGIKYSVFAIDAAYILPVSTRNHPLENTLRFTLSFDFDIKKN
ncbi:MAG: type IX secretion system outer membrane channel protein PorV [Bacteroidales bacterium]|nr:type IX secretion system outer membrane channel protein PorV [Bacteroidales bacterium]